MIYFSSQPIHPDSVDHQQFAALKEFQASLEKRGLYEKYESIGEFREKLTRQLAQTVIRKFVADEDEYENVGADTSGSLAALSVPQLSDASKQLLIETAQDPGGQLIMVRHSGGLSVHTNGNNFVERGSPRSEAMWEAAVDDLCSFGLLQDRGHEGHVFGITNDGYRIADMLRGS